MIDAIGTALKEICHSLGVTGQAADENADAFDTFGSVGATVGDVLGNLGNLAGIISYGLD